MRRWQFPLGGGGGVFGLCLTLLTVAQNVVDLVSLPEGSLLVCGIKQSLCWPGVVQALFLGFPQSI